MLFFDRPGHGWSERGRQRTRRQPARRDARRADGPARHQARRSSSAIPSAARSRPPSRSTIRKGRTGWSSCRRPPIPGRAARPPGTTRLTTVPVLGWLFSETVANPAGSLRLAGGDGLRLRAQPGARRTMSARADIPLVLRPAAFRANAIDVEGLYRFALDNRAALPRDHGADGRHLRRRRHGRLRGDPFARAGARHSGRRTRLGRESRPQAGLDRARPGRRGDREAGGQAARPAAGCARPSKRALRATPMAPAAASTRSRLPPAALPR